MKDGSGREKTEAEKGHTECCDHDGCADACCCGICGRSRTCFTQIRETEDDKT